MGYGARLQPVATPQRILQVTNPASNTLAILLIFHLINVEASTHWLGQVLFAFQSVEDMLAELPGLPVGIISQIRHIRFGGRPLGLRTWHGGWDRALRDSLDPQAATPPMPRYTYSARRADSRNCLWDGGRSVKYGCGWRELCYVNTNSKLLAFPGNAILPCWRRPQLSTWHGLLVQRDGPDSCSSVTICRSTQPHSPGSVLRTETRTIFE
ncbi:hypothetical protein BDW71DRAFT_208942 [Aspergillus fruticulosus]